MNMEWISVEDKLPQRLEFVLVYDNKGNISLGAWNSEKVHIIEWINEYNMNLNGVTHWMELPDKPQKEGSCSITYCRYHGCGAWSPNLCKDHESTCVYMTKCIKHNIEQLFD